MASYLLDTNVLLRAMHDTASEQPIVVNAVTILLANGDSLFLTPQAIVELWAVATRPISVNGLGWSPAEMAFEMEQLLARFPLLEETPAVFAYWRQLVTSHGVRGKQVHDARLVAVLQAHQVSHLLTFNTEDFKRYPDIKVVHPIEIT